MKTPVIFLIACLLAAGCKQGEQPKTLDTNVTDTPVTDSADNPSIIGTPPTGTRPIDDPEVKSFADAAHAADIKQLFEGTGPFTVFAPTNAAFDKFGQSHLKQLLKASNHDELVDLLIYHIVPGEYHLENLKTMNLKTIQGKEIRVVVENGVIKVNNATVIKGDMEGPNGVMHKIDTVLVPGSN